MDNDNLQASSGFLARRRCSRGGRKSRPNLLNRKIYFSISSLNHHYTAKSKLTFTFYRCTAANVAHWKTSTEHRLRRQNYRFLQWTRQTRQVSHSAQEELKQFFQLSLADQAKREELWKLSSEARRAWDRLSEERKAVQAEKHYLIPQDWWPLGKKPNRWIEQIANERKGKVNEMEDKKEEEDNRDNEMEVWKGTDEESEGDEGERIKDGGKDDEEGGVMLESEGEVIPPEPRSPFGGWGIEMEED